MIKFNWEDIKKYTNNNPEKIIEYFGNVYVYKGTMFDFISNNEWAAKIYKQNSEKESFIININDLIKNETKATVQEQYVYLDLASKRNIFTYQNTKGNVNFIPYWKVSDVYTDLDRLRLNRLLIINDKNIHFIYEGD